MKGARYVILVRNPGNGRVLAVDTGEGDDPPILVFETEREAYRAAREVPVCRAWPYVVVRAP
jgi:hypothetical protein